MSEDSSVIWHGNEELTHKQKDVLKLARYWRDTSDGKVTEGKRTRMCVWMIVLKNSRYCNHQKYTKLFLEDRR